MAVNITNKWIKTLKQEN